MKTYSSIFFSRIVTTLLFVGAICSGSNILANTSYLPGQYTADSAHTRASFVIGHFVASGVEGRFNDVKGEITLAEPFTNTKLTATIPVKSAVGEEVTIRLWTEGGQS